MNDVAQPPLVDFYLGNRSDSAGRLISDIWEQDYDWLEYTHDYIQWLFPLTTVSRFNPDGPVLDLVTIQAFRTSDELASRLLKSLKLMLGFYGFTLEPNLRISRSEEYWTRKYEWISFHNHNFLRITRILTSLRILGLEDHATEFLKRLCEVYEEEKTKIGSTTYRFWQNSASSNDS